MTTIFSQQMQTFTHLRNTVYNKHPHLALLCSFPCCDAPVKASEPLHTTCASLTVT